ncbi:MAG: hypothetical protein KBE04_07575 [Phycisphaerae bacterium]|nr:hypothetical protein [Phycisphaerae bacterium]
MSNREPHLEVLINRYLDGEISAREMEDLRARLDSDGQAKGLFEEMQALHRSCQEAIHTYVLQPCRPVEDMIAEAWQGHNRGRVWAGRVRRAVFSPFARGLAAGLLVGLSLHLALSYLGSGPVKPADRRVVSSPIPATARFSAAAVAEDLSQGDLLPQVDYYTFTDSQGIQWLIEGLSEHRIRTVADQRGF